MIRAGRPTVELLATHRPVSELRPLLHALARFADLHASDTSLTRPQARVATSTTAIGLGDALRDDIPLAVALSAGEEPAAEITERAEVLLVPCLPGATGSPEPPARTVTWPVLSIDTRAHPPLTPFVRARWRAHLGLPDPFVVVLGFDRSSALRAAAVPSALAVCSSAAVRGPHALLALALGTPLVTDAPEAERLGARDDHEVLVAAAVDAPVAAEGLATDTHRAVRLGWAARLLAERAHDVRPAALEVAKRLGLAGSEGPGSALQVRLDELGTPRGAPPAARALSRCEPFLSLAEVGDFAS